MRNLPTKARQSLPKSGAGIFTLRFHPNGRHLLSAGADRTIRLWNPITPLEVATLKHHAYQVLCVQPSQDGTRLISSGAEPTIFLYDLQSVRLLRRFNGPHAHQHRVNAVAFVNSHASCFVSASYDATAAIWDVRLPSNRPVQRLMGASDSVSAVISNIHHFQIITASIDAHVRTYDIRAGKLSTDTLSASVSSLSFTNDKSRLLAACLDDTLYLLNVSDGSVVSSFHGHQNHAFSLSCAVLHEDHNVVCGSEDGAVYFWDIMHGETPLVTNVPLGKPSVVSALDLHPTKSLLASATHHGDITLWH